MGRLDPACTLSMVHEVAGTCRSGKHENACSRTVRLLQRAYPPEHLIGEPVRGLHQGPRHTPHSMSGWLAAIFTCRSC